MSAAPPLATLDHLVVLATSLASGVAWAEATLGVTPGPGGEHPLMGTHNRLLRLSNGKGQPGAAYLEIIAINPAATPTLQPPEHRWFDMDDPALRERVAQMGPQLVHWVARVPDLTAALQAWQQLGIARGEARARGKGDERREEHERKNRAEHRRDAGFEAALIGAGAPLYGARGRRQATPLQRITDRTWR